MAVCKMANAYVALGWHGFPVTSVKVFYNCTLYLVSFLAYVNVMSFLAYVNVIII